MNKGPLVTVIIPVRELSYVLIFENLPAFLKQTYKNFEVIVLPNNRTLYDETLRATYPWIKIVPTKTVTRPAEKRDIGVKQAQGEIIAFIDDDAYPTEHWIEKAVYFFHKYEKRKVDAVCGPGLLPKEGNIWEYIFDEIFKTWIGSGGYAYRFVKGKPQYVDDYPSMNFLIKKKTFEEVGGFNSEYYPGEDSKLCEDLVYKLKRKIYYHPEVAVYHHRRNELKGYLKQHGNYGYHRGAFFAHGDQNSRRLTYLIPTFFLIYLITVPIYLVLTYVLRSTFYVTVIYFIPLILYKFLCMYLFLRSLINTKNIKIAIGTPFVLFLTHIVYGRMFIKGFFTGLRCQEKIYS